MGSSKSRERLLQLVRSEVGKYVGSPFDDNEDFTSDMHLASDDLTAVALSLERKLDLKIDRKKYLNVHNIEEYANLLADELSARQVGNE